jgi:hypothetical protein
MKRFLGVLICIMAFSGCDDGDLVIDTIDFSEVATKSCTDNNLIYKLKESEALILNLPEDTFTTKPTEVGKPTELIVNSDNQVVYNFYDGTVVDGNICDLIAPSTPKVKSQWKASDGIIQITTTAIKKLDETTNSTRITAYNHNIVFKNITFKKEDGTSQFYETFAFGDYSKPVVALPFDFQTVLNRCTTGEVYKFNTSESFTLYIDDALIVNDDTPIGSPRTGVIGDVKNKLAYRLFNGLVSPGYFCQTTLPLTPTVSEEWLGKIGGVIEVTTTANGPKSYVHVITLKNVTLEKDNNSFQLGTSYKYGELQTTKP